MDLVTRNSIFTIAFVILLLCIPHISRATPLQNYTTTYAITIQEDGTAVWHIEYRVFLATQEDMNNFENSSRDLKSTLHSQFNDLMQRSATQATVATSRHMEITDFSGDAVVQTSPTGSYGVVFFSFGWTGFAQAGSDLTIGDAFVGGMYLAKDTTLIIRYPPGYTVKTTEPAPDQVSDGLIWYGLRSFGGGEPRVVLERSAFPWLPVSIGLASIIIVGGTLIVFFMRKHRTKPDEPEESVAPLSEMDLMSLEDRIVQLLKTNEGGLFQSEIVKTLGLPKSTISSTLNELHRRGIIQKIKKGKENFIRLT